MQLKKTGWCFVNPCLQARSPGVKHQLLKNMKMNWEKWNVWIMLTIYYQNIFSNIWLARKWQQKRKAKKNKISKITRSRDERWRGRRVSWVAKQPICPNPADKLCLLRSAQLQIYLQLFSTFLHFLHWPLNLGHCCCWCLCWGRFCVWSHLLQDWVLGPVQCWYWPRSWWRCCPW